MIQIFLDGMPAIPKDNSNLKFTSENPYFTKSASYTYDIELPLSINENRRIFGWLHRMDVSKKSRMFEASLIVDNVTVLSGTAHITSVTETSVKVQLLGEAASYNYRNKMDETYIDELELGDWFMTTWPDGSYWFRRGNNTQISGWAYYPEGTKFRGICDKVFYRAQCTENGPGSDAVLVENLFSGKYPWVAYPIYNPNADFLCNGYAYKFKSMDNSDMDFFLRGYEGEATGRRPSDNPPVSSYAIQPYIWIMAEKIAESTGFTLEKENNALYNDEFYKMIFIANANNYIECNKCLPHWSVNEWWTQIEQTFGLVMTIDYSAKQIILRKRVEHYKQDVEITTLNDIFDEYTVDVDDETETDISSNNVGYADYENGPEDLLSEFIINNADFNDDFDSIFELKNWAKSQSMSEYMNVVFRCKEHGYFIYSEINNRFEEVDMFRPRIVKDKKKELDIELKIVPARFISYDCPIYPYKGNDDKPIGSFPVRVLQAPNISEMDWYKEYYDSKINIDAIINDDEDEDSEKETSSEDVLYIAIADLPRKDTFHETVKLADGREITGDFIYPRALLRARIVATIDGPAVYEDTPYSLSLIPNWEQINLAKKTLENNVKIDTTVRHCFKFVLDHIPDPGAIFLIHNKKFVCEKIEANINSVGLDKLQTGYFYEIEL